MRYALSWPFMYIATAAPRCGRLPTERPAIRAWLEGGARSLARDLAAAGLPAPSDDAA